MKIDNATDFEEFIEIFDRMNCIVYHEGYANSTYKRKHNFDKKIPIFNNLSIFSLI